MNTADSVLGGSGIIITRAHRETVSDISEDERADIRLIIRKAKMLLNERLRPGGYNVGWTGEAVGCRYPPAPTCSVAC
jgi:diadenosine tetraphosphate (Ap4A) HIT family hydrolase